METQYNDMQQIKRRFFAMRNGVIADTLRRAGSPFRIIFGLNLPQLVDIARERGTDSVLAQRLWENVSTRESMLLAPMLMTGADFSKEQALQWTQQVPSVEVADVLCHRLLRGQDYALELALELAENEDFLPRYTGLRLMCHISSRYPEQAHMLGAREAARADRRTQLLAIQLQES